MRLNLSRGKLLIISVLALGLIYLSFLNLRDGYESPRLKWAAAFGTKKTPSTANTGTSAGSGKKKNAPSHISSTNVQIGEPLFNAPSAPFDKAVESLRNDSSKNLRDGDETRKRFDKFAVALKTGAEVAVERASIHLVTFLKKINNLVIIGESPGIHIGDHPMIDVYTGVYDLVDKRLAAKKEKDEAAAKSKGSASKEKAKDGDDEDEKSRNLEKREPKEAAVIPAEDSRGWKLDAHKNIPGVEYLYRKYPNAEWYIMIDDDSYMFFDNLDHYLKGKNPDDPHYIGQSNVFVGCDGVQKFGDGPNFAHGGSGIVMSRGAVKKMMGGIEGCIKKYKDCWAGDVRLALCFRDNGILLTGGQGFDKEPPNDDIQRLHEVETMAIAAHPKSGVTYSDVLQNFLANREAIQKDTDRYGSDYDNRPSEDARACMLMCKSEHKCKSWTYDGSKCWLKDKIASVKEDKGKWSGILPEKYAC
ncbi:hypothetical protein HDU67_006671 [Dinochytrium kinnereticum]|nr:hypothetical protein HDU67_006671 [Dinochytrium kinnereticum]